MVFKWRRRFVAELAAKTGASAATLLPVNTIDMPPLGTLTEPDSCCYEFVVFKCNPLEIRLTKHFDSDLAALLQGFRQKLDAGESLPRQDLSCF